MGVNRVATCLGSSAAPVARLVAGVRLGDGRAAVVTDCTVAEETAVSFSYNGFAHAVMMATPADLEDFAVGFSITEGIARNASDLSGIALRPKTDGIALDIALTRAAFQEYLKRRRQRSLRGNTSCGLCGVESLADLRQEAPPLPPGAPITAAAVRSALAALRGFQPLGRDTGATHAAAWATPTGEMILVREDVGRHNALDKLIGACARKGIDLGHGFCVVTSRCSFEMAQKAIAAGMPALVAISAPTALAIETAEAAGLTLIALARSDTQIVYNGPARVIAEAAAS